MAKAEVHNVERKNSVRVMRCRPIREFREETSRTSTTARTSYRSRDVSVITLISESLSDGTAFKVDAGVCAVGEFLNECISVYPEVPQRVGRISKRSLEGCAHIDAGDTSIDD